MSPYCLGKSPVFSMVVPREDQHSEVIVQTVFRQRSGLMGYEDCPHKR